MAGAAVTAAATVDIAALIEQLVDEQSRLNWRAPCPICAVPEAKEFVTAAYETRRLTTRTIRDALAAHFDIKVKHWQAVRSCVHEHHDEVS